MKWRILMKSTRSSLSLFALGIALVIVNRAAGIVLPSTTRLWIDSVIVARHTSLIRGLIFIALASVVVQGTSSVLVNLLLQKAAHRTIHELRADLHAHIARLPIPFFTGDTMTGLTARIMSDTDSVSNMLGAGFVELVGSMLTCIFSLLVIAKIDGLMGLLAFVFLLAFGLLAYRTIGILNPIFAVRSSLHGKVVARFTESLNAIRLVRLARAEERETHALRALLADLLTSIFRSITVMSFLNVCAVLMVGIISILVLVLGTLRVLAGSMTVGDMVTVNLFLMYLVAPIYQAVIVGARSAEAISALDRIDGLLRAPREHECGTCTVADPFKGEVVFENVSFAYGEGCFGLREISFTARQGTLTAVVGPSGSGKSTLVGLLCSFYKPDAGTIYIDGIELPSICLHAYRSVIGAVLQDPVFLDASIQENIRFSRPQATDEEFVAACTVVDIDGIAQRFPEGYKALIGERGAALSGGQRQRLAIARCLLADPAIFILDEAVSSLDRTSELIVHRALQACMAGRTAFVVTHRLEHIRGADQIIVLDQGEIVECGAHSELMEQRGLYYRLYMEQCEPDPQRLHSAAFTYAERTI